MSTEVKAVWPGAPKHRKPVIVDIPSAAACSCHSLFVRFSCPRHSPTSYAAAHARHVRREATV